MSVKRTGAQFDVVDASYTLRVTMRVYESIVVVARRYLLSDCTFVQMAMGIFKP